MAHPASHEIRQGIALIHPMRPQQKRMFAASELPSASIPFWTQLILFLAIGTGLSGAEFGFLKGI
jgi:hypothetical protein